MDVGQQSVCLEVSCTNVGNDESPSPDNFRLTITPEVMDQLEQMIAYEVEARALFSKRFPRPDQSHLWESLELTFGAFAPVLDEEDDGGEDEFDDGALGDDALGAGYVFEYGPSDMRIDCCTIRLRVDEVFLCANLRNGETRLESESISYDTLREKFAELRSLMMSDTTVSMVDAAVAMNDVASARSARSTGPSL
jgi:hypothetical protein